MRVAPLDQGEKAVGDDLLVLSSRKASTSLKDRILPTLREAIVSGELAPDTHLPEVEIGRIFAVSRTPVREALATLQQEGLVTTVPRLGSYVCPVTVEDIDEIYQVRDAIEGLAASLAAEWMTERHQARLQALLEEMQEAASRQDVTNYANGLDEFHALVMRGAGNRTLEGLYHSLVGRIRRIRRITLRHEGRVEISLRHHLAIAAALLNRDPSAAEHMRAHLADARSVVKKVARTGPDTRAGNPWR